MTTCSTGHEHRVDMQALFHQHGVHCTAQRRRIWEFFASHPQGLTIAEAVAALKPGGIGQATVYRTVELLTRMGLLHHAQDPSDLRSRYMAICPGHAHALICQGCHAVVEFTDCDLSMLEKLLEMRTGYTVSAHHLVVYGTCPACAGHEGNDHVAHPSA